MYNLGKPSDMERFKKDLVKEVKENARKQIRSQIFTTQCPKCRKAIDIPAGINRCPKCGTKIDLQLNINF